ncbi:N-terminal fungal transcription regulatory domain-containing protein [Trichoderma ceciliae]
MPNYVSIIPRPPEDASDAGSTSTSNDTLESKRRRIGVSVACNTCRRKKIRCGGRRPICLPCENTTSDCFYRDDSGISHESQSLLLEIIRLLNDLTDDEVLNKVRTLNKEINASIILTRLRGEDITQLPFNPPITITMMSDEIKTLELAALYPNAYPTTPNLGPETLQEATYQQLIQSTRRDTGPASPQGERRNETERAQPLCDSRLAKLDISRWTNVPISNEHAAHTISLYLETDHPLLGFFDPNLFVSDLVMGNTAYCSAMLVNALLYWACMNSAAQDPDGGSLALSFCAEAESLWEHQRKNDSVLNLAAAQFLSLAYLGQGRNHVVLAYLNEASHMAVRMGLFGVEADHVQDKISRMPGHERSAQLYAAWGSFNWITHMSLFYRQPGLQCPKIPPQLPTPGAEQLDETNVSNNTNSLQLESNPPYMGGVFPYICQFWSILHELALMYRHKGPLAGDRRTLCFAEFKFRELLAWSNRLPAKLSRNDRSPHFVQILHIWLHAAILDLFRFSTSSPIRNQHLRTFTDPNTSPKNVCIASAHQLKHLIINYRLNFPSSSYTILWHTALTYLANAVLHDPKEENWFYYFLLCVYGYERLRPCWRVTQSISKALLSMALRKGDITSPTARQVLRDINGSSVDNLPGEVRATFMMDMDLATSDPESATVERMAEDFDRNFLLQQYTNIFGK